MNISCEITVNSVLNESEEIVYFNDMYFYYLRNLAKFQGCIFSALCRKVKK